MRVFGFSVENFAKRFAIFERKSTPSEVKYAEAIAHSIASWVILNISSSQLLNKYLNSFGIEKPSQ